MSAHTSAQTKSDELTTAQSAYDDAELAEQSQRTAFAEKQADISCPSLTAHSEVTAFDATAHAIGELKAVAAEIVTLKADADAKKADGDAAKNAYDTASAAALLAPLPPWPHQSHHDM